MNTSENLILKKSFGINAPAEKVWKALTDPDMIKRYFFGTHVTSNWTKGSPITFTGSWDGKEYQDKGTILEIIPQKLLRYNYWSNWSDKEDIPENYDNIEYHLEEKNGHTIVTVVQEGITEKEKLEHSEKNWEMVFTGLKELVENE